MYKILFSILLFGVSLAMRSEVAVEGDGDSSADRVVSHIFNERSIPITKGNYIQFFNNGHDKFVDLFREVNNAKSFIHLEYFNFRNDSIANLLFDLLAEKVREGVEVRAMYDAFGNASNNQPISRSRHDSICSLGIKLIKFDPIKFPWVNHIIPRDHRKIVVIDGRVAYTGGMNVADYYIEGIPEVGDWHDLHMHIEGPTVDYLHDIFCTIWEKETGEKLDGIKYFPQRYGVHLYPHMRTSEITSRPLGITTKVPFNASTNDAAIAVIDRATGKTSDAIRDLYVTMLDNAKYSVKIINPYFVPTHRVRQALKRAIDRGIKVEILLSAKSDIPLTPEATHYVGNLLMKRGARVWMFEGGFHHTKLMIVDDKLSTVGSSNLDARSLRCDYEVNTLIVDTTANQKLTELFENQKASSFEIHPGYWKTRKPWKRFVGWFGNLLTPVL